MTKMTNVAISKEDNAFVKSLSFIIYYKGYFLTRPPPISIPQSFMTKMKTS
jgi:hypothetical protein